LGRSVLHLEADAYRFNKRLCPQKKRDWQSDCGRSSGEENAMNRFLGAAGVVVLALACQAAYAAENPPQNCFLAHAKAEGRNTQAATEKALKLLRHHIADQHLIIPGGKKIGRSGCYRT
jgi:hypothetical protein